MRSRCNFPVSTKLLCATFLLGCALSGHSAPVPTVRSELMFALSSAVKERNRDGILACFNMDGADDGMRRTIEGAIQQICSWPTSHVFSTERSGDGPLRTTRNGKVWGLNGDWEFQVHIFLKREQPSKGYVFPAGRVKGGTGRYAVLLLVEQTP